MIINSRLKFGIDAQPVLFAVFLKLAPTCSRGDFRQSPFSGRGPVFANDMIFFIAQALI